MAGQRRSTRAAWGALALLALAWGVGPALPALLRGELLGHPYTDLYPSVWGLWWFARAQPGLPTHTDLLGFPGGMGFYYSSPLKGWAAWPLLPLLGLTATWNLLVLASRVGTVLAAGLAARAWGLGPRGALAAAAVYGCSPFFHGYAVEGIAEGTDGWPLALLAWALGRRRWAAAAAFLALSALANWYLGMAACLVAVLAALRDRRALLALGGLVAVLPFALAFTGAFPATEPLPDAVRAAMGARVQVPRPGLAPGLQPFAMNAWIGAVALGAALAARRPRWLLLALVPALLSLGRGPLYELPVLELVRFPYRWHAATLLLLALPAGLSADRWRRAGWLVGPAVALEGLLLGPAEPVLPGAPAEIPAVYDAVDGPVLEVPGPVARPPGEPNPSRRRARYLLYYQVRHGRPSPWVPDFNAVGVEREAPWLEPWRRLDPLEGGGPDAPMPGAGDVARLVRDGVEYVVIERLELGAAAAPLRARLLEAGAREVARDRERVVLRLPAVPPEAPPG